VEISQKQYHLCPLLKTVGEEFCKVMFHLKKSKKLDVVHIFSSKKTTFTPIFYISNFAPLENKMTFFRIENYLVLLLLKWPKKEPLYWTLAVTSIFPTITDFMIPWCARSPWCEHWYYSQVRALPWWFLLYTFTSAKFVWIGWRIFHRSIWS